VDTSGMFGARPILSWTNSQSGARLSLPFTTASSGRCAMRLTAAGGPEFGVYDIELDGETLVPTVGFNRATSEELDLSLGVRQLRPGSHTLSFLAKACSTGAAQSLAVELLRLLKLPAEATRPVKTHHEAHFIRLGIGRAVYAYRLAYGQVP